MPFDYFLRIDGIAGESTDAKHKGEIAVQTFLWGETQSGSPVGGGGGAGKLNAGPLILTARASKASPLLLLACASGQHIKSAVLSARRSGAGKAQIDFLTITLNDVVITSFEVNANTENGPVDEVSLAFAQIAVDYREQNADGSPGAVTHAGWDVKANKKL
ncbi:Hcp family type VI secretion system effector [Solirubrobacter soli]|uniref:Hcp family type VI secretion system effector n=1 Tax=Solirubrobacter soli TaxID=363832 RepID=UPI00041AB8BF|nr:type VI secretion system tube protein Hcp [Solirubrobacter soli]